MPWHLRPSKFMRCGVKVCPRHYLVNPLRGARTYEDELDNVSSKLFKNAQDITIHIFGWVLNTSLAKNTIGDGGSTAL